MDFPDMIFVVGVGTSLVDKHLQPLDRDRLIDTLRKGKKVIVCSEYYQRGEPEDDASVFFSETMPYAICLCLLPDNGQPFFDILSQEIEKREKDNRHCKVLLVQGFPYGTEQMCTLLSNINNKYPYMTVQVLLLDESRRFGATDISNPEAALSSAKESYEKIRQGCIALSEQTAFNKSYFSVTGRVLTQFKHKLKTIEYILEDFDTEFKYYSSESITQNTFPIADIYETLSQPDELDKNFCKINWNGKNKPISVIDSYICNFKQYVNNDKGDFYRAIAGFFRDTLEPVYMWDMQNDIDTLFEEIISAFVSKIERLDIERIKVADELEYRAKSGELQVQFKKLIVGDFLQNILPHIIKEKIKGYYQFLYGKTEKQRNLFVV